jgi:hypothetical protein
MLLENRFTKWKKFEAEPVLFKVYGAPELIPRNEFRQPGGTVRKPYSSSVPSPHGLFKNFSSVLVANNFLISTDGFRTRICKRLRFCQPMLPV